MAIMAVCSVFIVEFSAPAGANAVGAPASMTGSPGDGNNCTSCHSGTATVQAGLITSDIPLTGYVPGQTYTITGSITASGKTKFGFQISPQNASGALKGTMIVTNSTHTQLTNSGKYITHKFGGTNFMSGTASWSFDWTAPVAGSGTVTFYGSFNSTNSNSNTSGDLITLSTLSVSEDATVGIEDVENRSDISVYPNPFNDELSVKSVAATENTVISVSIMDIYGKEIKKFDALQCNEPLDLQELATGYYMVRIESAEGITVKRVAKK